MPPDEQHVICGSDFQLGQSMFDEGGPYLLATQAKRSFALRCFNTVQYHSRIRLNSAGNVTSTTSAPCSFKRLESCAASAYLHVYDLSFASLQAKAILLTLCIYYVLDGHSYAVKRPKSLWCNLVENSGLLDHIVGVYVYSSLDSRVSLLDACQHWADILLHRQ